MKSDYSKTVVTSALKALLTDWMGVECAALSGRAGGMTAHSSNGSNARGTPYSQHVHANIHKHTEVEMYTKINLPVSKCKISTEAEL